MNVHPGETLEEQIANIDVLASDVASRYRTLCAMPSDAVFGLGLRFGSAAAAEFVASPAAQSRLRAICAAHRLAPFTMNAFPFGVFHGSAVKEDVYRPTWSDPRRVAYTADAALSLALLMPAGIDRGSVSTAPLSYKTFGEDTTPAVANVVKALAEIRRIRERTGKHIILSMEPEPGCFPETTEETIAVVNRIKDACGEGLADDIGVCFDTAHLCVEFEDLAASARRFTAAGVQIGKCQISAALECGDTAPSRHALSKYAEGIYLHQTVRKRADGTLQRYGDLPEALKSPAAAGSVLRTHFHVPLFENGDDLLQTTSRELHAPELMIALAANGCDQFEVETYTWDVWRQCAHAATDIQQGIARELCVAAEIVTGKARP